MLNVVLIPCALVITFFWASAPPRFCPAGYEAESHFRLRRGDCIKCPAGKYKGVNGTQLCVKCPANHYSSRGGATRCDKCAEGLVSRLGSSRCDAPGQNACPKGKYDSGYLPEKCTKCKAGKYKDTARAGKLCKECPGNTYSEVGASTCIFCPGGYVSEVGSSRCAACRAGKYRAGNKDQSGKCRICPVNSYAPNNGTIECDICPEGSVSTPSRLSCSPCSRNTFAFRNGTCLPCQEGSESEQGSMNCSCKRGWTVDANASKIHDNAYRKGHGGYRCVKCPPNSYKDDVGNGQCQRCPSLSDSPEGSTNITECIASTLGIVTYSVMGSEDDKVRQWIEEQRIVTLQQTKEKLQTWGRELILAMKSFCAELFGSWDAFEKLWREMLTKCPDGGTHCYLAKTSGCCWSCEEVKEAFERKGWPDWWRTPLCGNRTEAPNERQGGTGKERCSTRTEAEFTAWFEATELYQRFSMAYGNATKSPSAKRCREVKKSLMNLMLQVHPDKYDATHPDCPRGISNGGAQRLNNMWSSLSSQQCKSFLRANT